MTEHGLNKDIAHSDRYMLGYVADPLADDRGKHEGCLTIPYLTDGGVKNIKFRRLGEREHKSKYIQHAGQAVRLYNTMRIDEAKDVIGLAEGEIDAIVATEILGVPTVGFPGVDAWRHSAEIWAPIFHDFDKVVVFADGDDPGREIASVISGSVAWANIVYCPPGEDVSSMVARGEEGINFLLKEIGRVTSEDD